MKHLHNFVFTTEGRGTPIKDLVKESLKSLRIPYTDACCPEESDPENLTNAELTALIGEGGGGPSSDAWLLEGNTGTTPPSILDIADPGGIAAGLNFIGTTDAEDVVFGQNGVERMRIDATSVVINHGLTLVTGDEGEGKHLVSDTNGVATWEYAVKPQVTTVEYGASPFSYTPTVGTQYIKFQVVGAGGGSGAISATSQKFSTPGGGGAYFEGFLNISDITFPPLVITIGAGGTAGTAVGNGGHGGTTTIQNSDGVPLTLISCQGGRRGDAELTALTLGGAGGSSFIVDPSVEEVIRRNGERGGTGSTTIRSGADGGMTPLGYGGKGENASNSSAPVGYGGGGHGVYGNAAASDGIAGANGVVIITEYFN